MRRVSIVLAALLLAGCASGTSKSSGVATSATGTLSAAVGSIAPAWTLPLSTGGMLSSATLKGKPVYLNFFASWCGPCQEEAPDIGALSQKYKKAGLITIGVDELENAAKAEQFRSDHHLPYRAVVDGGTLRDAYSINGLPVHAFIGRDGVLRTLRVGEMSKDEIDAAIVSILK